jgi:thioredoxin-dependent peroxiredoxin
MIGDRFPDYHFKNSMGKDSSIYDFLVKDYLIVFFYPKDFTMICTKEACLFRDNYKKLNDLNATVVGISNDDNNSHEKFKNEYQLPFDLIEDKNNELRRKLGIKKILGLHPGRETFVLLKDGTVIYKFRSNFDAESHVIKVLDVIKNHKI